LIAVFCAAVLPFQRGLAAVLILLPISNAYVGAMAAGILLLRWAITELPRVVVHRRAAVVVGIVSAFLLLAIAQSAIVSSDYARLVSESSQWVLGVGLFVAIMLHNQNVQQHRYAPQQSIAHALAYSAVLLAVCQLTLKWLDMSPDETSATPMLSPTNNYVSILALFGLVVLPMVFPAEFHPKWRLPMFCFAFAAMYFNESRAAMLLTIAAVGFRLINSIRDIRAVLVIGAVITVLGASLLLVLAKAALYDPQSVGSVTDFQTNYSNLERLGILFYAWELFNANPWGSGIGSSSDLFSSNPYTIGTYPDAHNMLAMLAVELGWLGVAAYLMLFALLSIETLRRLLKRDAACLLPALLLTTTFYDALLFNGVLAIYFWTLLAIVITSTRAASRLVLLVPVPTRS